MVAALQRLVPATAAGRERVGHARTPGATVVEADRVRVGRGPARRSATARRGRRPGRTAGCRPPWRPRGAAGTPPAARRTPRRRTPRGRPAGSSSRRRAPSSGGGASRRRCGRAGSAGGWGAAPANPAGEKSRRGGALNSTTASVAVTGRCLPVRISHGTPAHRHESISSRSATKVSTSDAGSTPSSSR